MQTAFHRDSSSSSSTRERSTVHTAGPVSYTWLAQSRSESTSQFTVLALNKPSSSSSTTTSSSQAESGYSLRVALWRPCAQRQHYFMQRCSTTDSVSLCTLFYRPIFSARWVSKKSSTSIPPNPSSHSSSSHAPSLACPLTPPPTTHCGTMALHLVRGLLKENP